MVANLELRASCSHVILLWITTADCDGPDAWIDPDLAATFSFLLFAPTVIGAFILEVRQFAVDAWLPITIACFTTIMVSFFVLKWLITIVKKGKLHYFSFYCSRALHHNKLYKIAWHSRFMDGKRQVAHKVRLRDLIEGTYTRMEGEWEPNFIQTRSGKSISRVNVIAVVASEPVSDQNSSSFVIDDASGQIPVRAFGQQRFDVKLGDVVLLIGRPREFSGQIYIVPEIIKRIEDTKWIDYRKLELGQESPQQGTQAQLQPIPEEKHDEVTTVDALIAAIKSLDQGDGADTEAVLASCTAKNTEQIIDNLLKEGEIFELTPGKIKVLE